MDKLAAKIDDAICYSRQPSPEELQQLIETEGFKSVVNLRDASEDDFLDGEPEIIEKAGVKYANIPVKTVGAFSAEKMEKINQAVDSLPKPILMHCHHGQRAAVASLLYNAKKKNQTGEDVIKSGKELGFDFQANQDLTNFINNYTDSK